MDNINTFGLFNWLVYDCVHMQAQNQKTGLGHDQHPLNASQQEEANGHGYNTIHCFFVIIYFIINMQTWS